MIVLVSILLYPHSYFYFFSICAAPTICSKLHSKLHALSLFSPEPPTTLAPFRLLPGPSPSTSLPAVRGVGAPPARRFGASAPSSSFFLSSYLYGLIP
jgi:hypothetical protein